MKKQKNKKPKTGNLPKRGILVRTTRSGWIYASYFDPENDFDSLYYSLVKIIKNKHDCWDGFIIHEQSNTDSLWSDVQEYLKNHDNGSIDMVENL